MKKIYILFALISLFMVQFSCINVVIAADDENINLDGDIYKNLNTSKLSCGNGMVSNIPKNIVDVVHIAYIVIQVIVPIILVVMGMITLMKSISSGKEDDIKKSQMSFVKKLISAALVFFVFVIVKLVVSLAADAGDNTNIMKCADCFLNKKSCVTESE